MSVKVIDGQVCEKSIKNYFTEMYPNLYLVEEGKISFRQIDINRYYMLWKWLIALSPVGIR